VSTNIYLVVAGEYSDYGVACAFSDHARAQAYCTERNAEPQMSWRGEADRYRVQPIDLDPPLPSEVKAVTTSASDAEPH